MMKTDQQWYGGTMCIGTNKTYSAEAVYFLVVENGAIKFACVYNHNVPEVPPWLGPRKHFYILGHHKSENGPLDRQFINFV